MQSQYTEQIASRCKKLRDDLSITIQDLLDGSLAQEQGVNFNLAAASPVPLTTVASLAKALAAPHRTYQRGIDSTTIALDAELRNFENWFCSTYLGNEGGAYVYGSSATHVLRAMAKTLSDRYDQIAFGSPDHKSLNNLGEIFGTQNTKHLSYNHNGFYQDASINDLASSSFVVYNLLHGMFGTLQDETIRRTHPDQFIVLDISQALATCDPSLIRLAINRVQADAVIWGTGKFYSPLHTGVLWVRDKLLLKDLSTTNPELLASKSSTQIHQLLSIKKFAESIDWVQWHTLVHELTRYFLYQVSSLDNIEIVGCSSWLNNTSRHGIVSISANNMSSVELGQLLANKSIYTRADGSCISSDKGAYDHVRFSFSPITTIKDIDKAVLAIREITA